MHWLVGILSLKAHYQQFPNQILKLMTTQELKRLAYYYFLHRPNVKLFKIIIPIHLKLEFK